MSRSKVAALVIAAGVAWLGGAAAQQSQPADSAPSASAAPASTETDSRRTPKQLEILRELLRERERPAPIIPSRHRAAAARRPGQPLDAPLDPNALPDGAMIVERSARLVVEDGLPRLVLTLQGETQPRSMQLNRNEWLEALERAAAEGTQEFVVTAEVTLYRGRNYLILRKVLERLSNGNLTP